jgi:hypothetical protein
MPKFWMVKWNSTINQALGNGYAFYGLQLSGVFIFLNAVAFRYFGNTCRLTISVVFVSLRHTTDN